jgi:hypothetical protein
VRSKIVLGQAQTAARKESSTNTNTIGNDQAGSPGCGRCHTDFSALGCFYSSSSYCDGSDSSQTSEATNPLSAVERPSSSEICAPTLLHEKKPLYACNLSTGITPTKPF